jgi:sulfide:quinone oxidoreductase
MTMHSPSRRPLKVLIAGGGVAALEALLALKHIAQERVYIELLAPEPQFWYRPLATAEPFGLSAVHGLDLSVIADENGAEFTLGRLASVDEDRQIARTSAGAELSYDALLIAIGARPVASVPGAYTFRGPADSESYARLLIDLADGAAHRVVFAVPGGVGWPLPLYELALQTAAPFAAPDTQVEIVLVTHEEAPLELFGHDASTRMAALLAERGIELHSGTYAVSFEDGRLELKPGGELAADLVVAVPRLQPPAIPGITTDAQGFVPTDEYGRVRGVDGVFAAGDITTFPVKQGGLAAQQADAAAESIAALAGAEVEPEPFRPVLRGLILTGDRPVYARAELDRPGSPTLIGTEPLWWPPGKIVGRYLAPFLAERAGAILGPPRPPGSVPVEADLSSLLHREYEKLPG